MISLVRGGGRFPWTALAWALGIWVFSGLSAIAYGDDVEGTIQQGHTHGFGDHNNSVVSQGTLGYGPPGLHPGYQGFGLSFHRGYGYGGYALGVGAEGGYPFYGGPGYPHTWPRLNRFCGITPFPYYGGPEQGYTHVGSRQQLRPWLSQRRRFRGLYRASSLSRIVFRPLHCRRRHDRVRQRVSTIRSLPRHS